MTDKLKISLKRKIEIDKILKENERKYKSGELEKHSLKEFEEKQKMRIKELEQS